MTDLDIAKDRADWLLDAVAGATQNRQFLRGDPAYDEVAGGAILLNGEKAINVALSKKDAEITRLRAALTARDERMKAEGARDAQAELIEEPTEPGSFVGDIWFGRQDNRTYGTHRWDGAAWQALPTETEALIGLLAKERAKIARLTEALKEIAHQKKTSELDTEYDVECADFEAGYDACIDRARAALQENAHG